MSARPGLRPRESVRQIPSGTQEIGRRSPIFRQARQEGTAKIERLFIPGPAGRLEALFEWDPQWSPPLAAVICHPHPLYGGTMHNKVAFRAARAALAAEAPALRFNFRGTGKSYGSHAGGIGERDDLRAALDYLADRFPGLPICVMGFSFGAWVGLAVGVDDSRAQSLVGLGLPADSTDFAFLEKCTKPILIVQGTMDQYGGRVRVQTLLDSLAPPKKLRWVEGADHFFTGKLDEVQTAIEGFLRLITPGPK